MKQVKLSTDKRPHHWEVRALRKPSHLGVLLLGVEKPRVFYVHRHILPDGAGYQSPEASLASHRARTLGKGAQPDEPGLAPPIHYIFPFSSC